MFVFWLELRPKFIIVRTVDDQPTHGLGQEQKKKQAHGEKVPKRYHFGIEELLALYALDMFLNAPIFNFGIELNHRVHESY